jgi:sugar (pentulose or hexulose) kinase
MQDVYLVYDIGKTNKKCLVFSAEGTVIDQYAEQFDETEDEDGFPCDDLQKLENWVLGQYELLQQNELYHIKAINFATYGASFVHVDEQGKPLTPLYNYLKPLPQELKEQFLHTYFNDDADAFSTQTASPFMGMLNSGLQLYWLKHYKADVWDNIKYSLHLPQYLHYIITGNAISDYTSIGCHTGLWNFETNAYHNWVIKESLHTKLAPICTQPIACITNDIDMGGGLHDSSSALIPYLQTYKNTFLLISTGTWCINLNPFNTNVLTTYELHKDTLCFLQADGTMVKASRIFLGKEHEYQANRIAAHFKVEEHFYTAITKPHYANTALTFIPACMEGSGPMPEPQTAVWDISIYTNAAEAYTALMQGLTYLLKQSIDLVITENIKQFYIDGGFAENPLLKIFLERYYPTIEVIAAEFPQATSYGAFLQIAMQVNT